MLSILLHLQTTIGGFDLFILNYLSVFKRGRIWQISSDFLF